MSKSIDTAAAAAFSKQRGHFPWSKLYGDQWLSIYSSGVSDKAKLLWVYLQHVLNQSGGYLFEEKSRTSMSDLAFRLQISAKELRNLLSELFRIYALRKDDDGNIYDPRMLLDKGSTAWETQRKRAQRSGGNPTNVPAMSHDIKNKNKKQEEDQDKEKEVEEENGNPSATASISADLSDEEWIRSLKSDPKHAGKDIDAVIRKCQKYCRENEKDLTRTRLIGWVEREENLLKISAPSKPNKRQEPDGWKEVQRKIYPESQEFDNFWNLPSDIQLNIRKYIDQNTLKSDQSKNGCHDTIN